MKAIKEITFWDSILLLFYPRRFFISLKDRTAYIYKTRKGIIYILKELDFDQDIEIISCMLENDPSLLD